MGYPVYGQQFNLHYLGRIRTNCIEAEWAQTIVIFVNLIEYKIQIFLWCTFLQCCNFVGHHSEADWPNLLLRLSSRSTFGAYLEWPLPRRFNAETPTKNTVFCRRLSLRRHVCHSSLRPLILLGLCARSLRAYNHWNGTLASTNTNR